MFLPPIDLCTFGVSIVSLSFVFRFAIAVAIVDCFVLCVCHGNRHWNSQHTSIEEISVSFCIKCTCTTFDVKKLEIASVASFCHSVSIFTLCHRNTKNIKQNIMAIKVDHYIQFGRTTAIAVCCHFVSAILFVCVVIILLILQFSFFICLFLFFSLFLLRESTMNTGQSVDIYIFSQSHLLWLFKTFTFSPSIRQNNNEKNIGKKIGRLSYTKTIVNFSFVLLFSFKNHCSFGSEREKTFYSFCFVFE